MASAFILRCAQGPVFWHIRHVNQLLGIAHCVNDGFEVAISRHADTSWMDSIAQITQHSVGLRGALVETVILPDVLA